MSLPDVVSGLLLSEGAEVQILLATGFKAFENVSWISWNSIQFYKSPKLYEVIPKEEIADFEEVMRKTIADIVSEASSVACWVYVQKYVKQKTLDEMLQEWSEASQFQFIIVVDAWFERLMADQ